MASLLQTLAVAQYLSFRHAAAALGISQSSVSARVKALEDELGILLFDRNTRGVRLTEAGRHFVTQVDGAVEIIDQAVKTAGMLACGEQGDLRIGVYTLVAGGFLDRLLECFCRRHSLIRLQVTEGTARDTQIQVRENRLDVAFMAGTQQIPDLHSKVLWRDRLMVAVPKAHPLAKSRHIEWKHLAEETFLVRHGGTGPQVHDLILLRMARRWPVPNILRFDVGRDSLLLMVATGYGISLFAEESAAVHTPNVTFLPISDESETVAFSAVWSPHNQSPALRNLLNLANEMSRSTRAV